MAFLQDVNSIVVRTEEYPFSEIAKLSQYEFKLSCVRKQIGFIWPVLLDYTKTSLSYFECFISYTSLGWYWQLN